jgi:hypothetical protein
MMSKSDKVMPFASALAMSLAGGASRVARIPGLRPEAIQGLEALYPGTLTPEMRSLLETTCGLSAAEFGTIDLTGHWHPEESMAVFRPCLTLAIDDEGRRWIAETSRQRGLPSPVWCILPEPAVALHVSEDLGSFLTAVDDSARRGLLLKWLRNFDKRARTVWARTVWAHRQTLARKSFEHCRQDSSIRGWLRALPFDAQVYDLREPSSTPGWPYGIAGPDGRTYRCGRLPIFAVATSPTSGRWTQHTAHIARPGELLDPPGTPSAMEAIGPTPY